MEDDLVKLIERLLLMNLKAGTDVGVVSYIMKPHKKIILDVLQTISTDFAEMGKIFARLIMQDSREHVEVPFKLTSEIHCKKMMLFTCFNRLTMSE